MIQRLEEMSPSGKKITHGKERPEIVSGTRNRSTSENTKTRREAIGIRNPYALADIISHGESRGWCCRPPKLNRLILEKYLGISYKKLFDPVHGSPLFAKKRLAQFGYKAEKKVLSKRDYSEKRDICITVGDSEGSAEACQAGIDDWDDVPSAVWSVETSAAGLPVSALPMFDDPVQGPALDCYYLATLSSLAWHNLINRRLANPITFYDAKNGNRSYGTAATSKLPKYRCINTELPLNGLDEPACSHSKDRNEIWVPFYEKVYACYLEDIGTIAPPSKNPDRPQVCLIPEGSPCTTLKLLTGKTPVERLCSTFTSTTAFYSEFMKIIDRSSTTPSQKTKYPTVAYTYCCGDPVELKKKGLAVPGGLCAAPAGSGVLYEDDIIPDDHAFSIHGYHSDDDGDYVILRNPIGPVCGACGTKVPFTLSTTDLKFATMTYPLNSPYHTPGVNNGVFALEFEDFLKRFQGYCWAIV